MTESGAGQTSRLHLSPRHREKLEALLREHLPGIEVWAYGSRVNGQSHDGSDLDLVLRTPGLQEVPIGPLADFTEALHDSTLPFLVEARDWARLPERFHKEIKRGYVVLTEPKKDRNQDWERGWHTASLGDVIELKRGYDLPQRQRVPGTVPIVSSSGVTGHHSKSKVRGPGVVTGRYGTLGKIFFIPNDFWPLNTTLYVRDFKGNDPRFISYFLRELDFSAYSDKAAVPGLNRNHLHQETVRIPKDVNEQRAIAHILGTLDDKIELNRRMNETLEAMARALFKSWFVDFEPVRAKMEDHWRPGESLPGLPAHLYDLFPDRLVESELGEVPEGWEVKALGDLCHKPQYGYTASAIGESVGPKFLRITDINKRPWINWSSVPYCKANREEYQKYRLCEGDILIARMADPGHGVLIEENYEAVFASYLIRFRTIKKMHTRFLQYWLKSSTYWQLVQGRSVGTTRFSLNAKMLGRFPLLIPMDGITHVFSGQIDALRRRLIASASEMQRLGALRDFLLPRLMSGAIRLRETEQAIEAME